MPGESDQADNPSERVQPKFRDGAGCVWRARVASVHRTEHQRGEQSPEVPSSVLWSASQCLSARKVLESGERTTWKDVKERGLELTGLRNSGPGVSLSTQVGSIHRSQN